MVYEFKRRAEIRDSKVQGMTEEDALVYDMTEEEWKAFWPLFSPWDGCCNECSAHLYGTVAYNHYVTCSRYKESLVSWILEMRSIGVSRQSIESMKKEWLEFQKDRKQGW